MGQGANVQHGRSSCEEAEDMKAVPDEDYKEYLRGQQEAFELMLNKKLPLETQIEHYYPPSFPIDPVVNARTVLVCRESWEAIKKIEHQGRSGMVYFFDVFYSRLFDRSSLFKDFFKGDMKKKGKILIRIMEFFCSLDVNNLNAFYSNMMGLSRMHHKMGIRPWMYSVFVETMVNTISFVLDDLATLEVSSCWTNNAAFVMRALLPGSIAGHIQKEEADFVWHDPNAPPQTQRATENTDRRGAQNSSRTAGDASDRKAGSKHDTSRPPSSRESAAAKDNAAKKPSASASTSSSSSNATSNAPTAAGPSSASSASGAAAMPKKSINVDTSEKTAQAARRSASLKAVVEETEQSEKQAVPQTPPRRLPAMADTPTAT